MLIAPRTCVIAHTLQAIFDTKVSRITKTKFLFTITYINGVQLASSLTEVFDSGGALMNSNVAETRNLLIWMGFWIAALMVLLPALAGN